MKPTALLKALETVTGEATMLMDDSPLAIRVDRADAIAASLLLLTLERWPDATVGELAAAFQNALFWQKLLYSMGNKPPDQER